MYVARLRSNVKKGIDVELGQKTVVVGPNGSGKSGLVASLELVLSGRCREVGAIPAEIAGLSANEGIDIKAIASTGKELCFSVAGSMSHAKRPNWTGKVGAVLVDEVTDLLRADPKRIRQTLLSVLATDAKGLADLENSLPDSLRAVWMPLWNEALYQTDNPIDALLLVSKLAKKKAREGKQSAASFLGSETPVEPSEMEIESLKGRIAQLQIQPDRKRQDVMAAQILLLPYAERAGICPLCGGRGSKEEFVERRQNIEMLSRPTRDPEIDRLTSRLRELEAQSYVAKEWHKRRVDCMKESASAESLSALVRVIDQYVATELPKMIEEFQNEISSVLGQEFRVELFDDEKPICRLGIRRNGHMVYWKALSGAERTEMISAICAVWAQSKNEPCRLIVIDDVWLDGKAMARLTESMDRAISLEKGPTQVILCAVELPKGFTSDWRVVRL